MGESARLSEQKPRGGNSLRRRNSRVRDVEHVGIARIIVVQGVINRSSCKVQSTASPGKSVKSDDSYWRFEWRRLGIRHESVSCYVEGEGPEDSRHESTRSRQRGCR